MYKAVRKALVTSFTRSNFRIVHLSIQGTHIHLLIEADDKTALSRGMQAFQISAAKHLNAAMAVRTGKARRGNVFVDRYHARIIRTPKQARNALAYVLNNWRKHRENRNAMAREHRWRLRSVLECADVRGLARHRRERYRVARDLRATSGVGAKDVAVTGRLEEAWPHLVDRDSERETAGEPAGDGRVAIASGRSLRHGPAGWRALPQAVNRSASMMHVIHPSRRRRTNHCQYRAEEVAVAKPRGRPPSCEPPQRKPTQR